MNEASSAEDEVSKASKPSGRKTRWAFFIGLLVYLLATGLNSLLGLIMGIGGSGWGGTLELKERMAFLIVGANLPLTLAAVVVFAVGLRKPPVRWRVVSLLVGLGLGCVLLTVLGDVLLGIYLY